MEIDCLISATFCRVLSPVSVEHDNRLAFQESDNESPAMETSKKALFQASEILASLLGNRGPKVLDLGQVLPNKYDESRIWNVADPGITGELGIEGQKAFGPFGITAGRGLPVDQASFVVELTDRMRMERDFLKKGVPRTLEAA